jgi:hypothetical protein
MGSLFSPRGGIENRSAIATSLVMAVLLITWTGSGLVAGQSQTRVVPLGAASPIALEGATLIDGMGGPLLADAVVVIRGNRIEAVGKRGAVPIPADARHVDLRGAFVIPGLMDAHAHTREDWFDELFLLHGVTSVMSEGVRLEWDLAQQEGRAKGLIRGPRYYTAGPAFGCTSNTPDCQPEALRKRVQYLAKAGVKKIAVVQSTPLDVIRVLVDEAHKQGLPVAGETLFIREASAFGYDAVAHTYGIAMGAAPDELRTKVLAAVEASQPTTLNPLSYLVPPASDELRDLLLKRHVFLLPMLGNDFKAVNDRVAEFREDNKKLLDDPLLDYVPVPALLTEVVSVGPRSVPPLARGIWSFGTGYYGSGDPRAKGDEPHRKNYHNIQTFVGQYAAGGGKILTGSDVGNYVLPGVSVQHEMELLVDAGLTAMQALQAATLWGAEFLHQEAEVGSVRPGRFADIVVLDANPLENIANIKKIRSVFMNGVEQEMTYHRDYRNPIPMPPRAMGPTIGTTEPTIVVEGSGAFDLTVRGAGFIPESIVTVNDVWISTRFMTNRWLVATVPPALIEHVGTLAVRVVNPAGYPRGGTSDIAPLFVKFK